MEVGQPIMEENESLELSYDILTLLDEDGKEHQFELVDRLEHDDNEYVALIPIYEDADDLISDSGELIIMMLAEDNGEEVLDIVESDELYDQLTDIFIERLADDFDFEFEDEE